jgi:hypothetical protein
VIELNIYPWVDLWLLALPRKTKIAKMPEIASLLVFRAMGLFYLCDARMLKE